MSVGSVISIGQTILEHIDAVKASKLLGYQNIKVFETDQVNEMSVFGLPVFGAVTLEETKYKKRGKAYRIPELTIQACVVEIDLPVNIVKTPLNGLDGTVKEYISMDDYQIMIRGVMSNNSVYSEVKNLKLDDARYPYKWQKALDSFPRGGVSIGITHEIINNLGVYEIVIERLKWLPAQGFINMCPFEIQAVSELPVEVRITENLIKAKK